MKKKGLISLLLALTFFIVSFITLKDYGISWDETLHFRRGQAYLHYFLTGEKNYNNLPEGYRRSYYQNDTHNGEFWFEKSGGHPPLNGDLAAISNFIFFQKLGILGDIESHHLFNIFSSSVLVFVVSYFAISEFGLFAGLISTLSLSLYPLFFSESHFNVKDPPLAAFFAGTIISFYFSVKKKSWKWLLLSFLFLSLSVGTKFNTFFVFPIIIFWTLFRYRDNLKKIKKEVKKIPRKYLIMLLVGPLIVFTIFVGSWPFLWQNFPENLFSIFGWYKDIGTNLRYQPDSFFVLRVNTFPVKWILYTTPPVVLLFLSLGIIHSIKNIKKNDLYFLLLLWFFIPIVRVTLPNTTIYGGIRQIFEFIPALSILSGIGAKNIFVFLNSKIKIVGLKIWVIVLTFIILTLPIIRLHPNENVYFNFLIGGLSGAKEKNFPSWGNSFGNAYFDGIKWLNKNAEEGAKLALIQGTVANAPEISFREDIDYSYFNFSGIERKGEYLMELTFNDTIREFYYQWEYVEKFLVPVYELKVDGVAILAIWKNDLEHTKEEYKYLSESLYYDFSYHLEDNKMVIDLKKELLLSRTGLSFVPTTDCYPITVSYVEISLDGENWEREDDKIPDKQLYKKFNLENNTIEFFFAGKKARFVRFWFDNKESCGLGSPTISIKALK